MKFFAGSLCLLAVVRSGVLADDVPGRPTEPTRPTAPTQPTAPTRPTAPTTPTPAPRPQRPAPTPPPRPPPVNVQLDFAEVSGRDSNYRADIREAVDRVASDGTRVTASFDTRNLERSERDSTLNSIQLLAGEEIRVAGDETSDAVLCREGCAFERGSVVRMDAGVVRLPRNASSGTIRVDLRPDATLRIEGGERDLIGDVNGQLRIDAGTVRLRNITGSANITIKPNARLVLQGDGDTNVRVDSRGEIVLAGRTRFTAGLNSRGRLNITSDSKVEFSGTERATVSGEGITSFGEIEVGDAGLAIRGQLQSYGKLNVSSRVSFEPRDEHRLTIAGNVDNISDIEAFKGTFKQDIAAALTVEPTRIEILSVEDVDSTGRRLSAEETMMHVFFALDEKQNDTIANDEIENELESKRQMLASASFLENLIVTGKAVHNYDRVQKSFQSIIGGDGIRLARDARLEIKNGNVSFEGPVDSSGKLEIVRGGRAQFAGDGISQVGGEGLTSDSDSRVEIVRGEVRLRGPMNTNGKIDIEGGKLSLQSGELNTVRGNSTFDLKSGAEVELKNGTLRLETDVESDGKFSVRGGEVRFSRDGGTSRIRGDGMEIVNDAKVEVEGGRLEFGDQAPLTSTGKVDVGAGATVSFGQVSRHSEYSFSGAVQDIDNVEGFESDFKQMVAADRGISADSITIRDIVDNVGRRRRLAGDGTFKVSFEVSDLAQQNIDTRTDAEKLIAMQRATVRGFGIVEVRDDLAESPNRAKGKGLAVKDGGKVELKEGSLVEFSNVTSDGLLELKSGSKVSFDSENSETHLRGQGLKSDGGKVDIVRGGVRAEAPLISNGTLSKVSIKTEGRLDLLVDPIHDHELGGQGLQLDGRLKLRQGATAGRRRLSGSENRAGAKIAGKMNTGESSEIELRDHVALKISADVHSRGIINVTSGANLDLKDGYQRHIDGRGLRIDESSSVNIGRGTTNIRGEFVTRGVIRVSEESALNIGGIARLKSGTFESNGTVRVSAAQTSRRQLQTAGMSVVEGNLSVEGDTQFTSNGLLVVPSGASITFDNAAGSAIITGGGVDNSGTFAVESGIVNISEGGIRSTGSVSVSGGSLELTSNEPSLIAGTGLTVTSGASVFISGGSVAFEAELVGDINADAPVTFLDSVGGCPSSLTACDTVTASSPQNSGSTDDETSNTGMIIGGVVAALVVIGIVLYFACQSSNKNVVPEQKYGDGQTEASAPYDIGKDKLGP